MSVSDSSNDAVAGVPHHTPDPQPQAPIPPDLEACCGNGCDPCIFDLHDLAMDEYRQALRAWQARQVAAQVGASVAAHGLADARAAAAEIKGNEA